MADQQSAERSNETKSKEIAMKDSGHPTESAKGNKEVASTKEIARKDSGNPTESAEGNKEVASTKEIARKDSRNPTELAEGNKEVASTIEIARKDSRNPTESAEGNKEVASTKEISRKDSRNPTELAKGNKEVASTKEIAKKDSKNPTELAEGNKEVASTKEIARKDSGNPTESAEGNKEVASTKEIARKDSGHATGSAEGNKEVASTKEIARKDSGHPTGSAEGNKEVASTKEIARKDSGNPIESADGNEEVASTKDSGTLFMELLKTSIPGRENFEASIAEIAKKSNGLPIAVVKLVAEALNLSGANDLELSKLENALKEVANYEEVDKCTSLLLRLAIQMLHGGDHGSWSTPGNDTLVNCYWHSWEFVSRHGAIDYNELIFSWILEGYFGSVDHIKQTYQDGHSVLMKLIGCGLLKMLEDNLVMMEELVLPIPDCRRVGYEQRSILGLAHVLDESIWKGFGTLAPSDYMIKTPTRGLKQDKYISTLLIHGSRLCREDPDLYFKKKLGLQNLAIFNPRFESFPPLLSKMEELCVLILRGCDQLQNIDDIQHLKSLIVLEISNFSEKITDDLFKKMTNLRTLSFCAVSIKTLPPSLSNLSQLRWLILRGCTSLESLPNLKAHTNLEVLDLSGSTSLLNITDKTFSHLKKIQFLDFSRTSIKRFPFLHNLENLTRLLLHDCKLNRLPSFKSLPALQCIDISASNMLKDIKEDFSENKDKLKILDLSKTKISRLPSNFGNFPNLELLDLSDAPNCLPKISNLVNLRQLFLKNCALHKLPKLEGVTRLEELDLSNASSLVEIEDQSFDYLSSICLLDFSHTKIKTLPSLAKLNNLRSLNLSRTGLTFPYISNLTNLTQLSLRGCSISDQSEPNFGEHKKLKVLDLSETGITSLPTLNNLTSLRELKLKGCSELQQLQHLDSLAHLEVLDLRETGIKKFPNEIYTLTHLKHLDLPKGIQDFDLQKELNWNGCWIDKMKSLPKELNWNECCILKQWKNIPCISVEGTKSFQDLNDKPEFHISVYPEQGKVGDIHWHKVDPFFRRIYFNTLSFPGECRQYLEIVGFDSFPAGVEDALKKAAYVSLIGNKFITRLSDLGVKNVDAMKGCWLQRCVEMEKVSEETEAKMVENLEILWASNLPQLQHVCSRGFKNLTEMYLDCCPLIKSVFHSSHFPEKLKVLQIKFCEDLVGLFEPNNVLEADKKWSLQKLLLVELPKLTDIGVPESKKIVDVFTSLKAIKVKECPMLDNMSEQIREAGGRIENSNNVEEH
ncbi:hypothetical protein I3842_12G026200 [Carya illinoinensis]|uniref:Disease resistance protein At4g27190-like leucine-rich repeats domain-containing protein n=1 Tax=Carya illinoinensis TaxID=32201 RepID=A0A922DG05_CARIL|nr:hypothetical protein I3842_12G026200 [Carya illinoinensis]